MALYMDTDAINENSNTGNPAHYAYQTARSRWTKIWSTAIQDIEAAMSHSDLSDQDKDAGNAIIKKLVNLIDALKTDGPLEPIPDDGGSDVAEYNKELESLNGITWLAAPWLFSECFMYRLVHTFFTTSTPFWQSFDVFSDAKQQSLNSSHAANIELVNNFCSTLKSGEGADTRLVDEQTQEMLFDEIMQIALWGNSADLTLLSTLSVDEIGSRQGQEAREASRSNTIVNDTEQVWKLLLSIKDNLRPSTGIIHIVLDNSGFELLTDLAFAGYLLDNGFAKRIVLHGKRMPWFVSDVNAADLQYQLESFVNGAYHPENATSDDKAHIQAFGRYWQNALSDGRLVFRAHPYWTTQHSFGRMPQLQADLFEELANADLVVFKGDLNYRKLVYDGTWPHTTPFSTAMGPFALSHQGSAVRTLVLRTCKADVCVGLKAGQEQRLDPGWTRYGKYGVISFWDAKAGKA